MSYVDAGYAIGLSTLFVYSIGLVVRRRRLLRAVAAVSPAAPDGTPAPAHLTGGPVPVAPAAEVGTTGEPPRGGGE